MKHTFFNTTDSWFCNPVTALITLLPSKRCMVSQILWFMTKDRLPRWLRGKESPWQCRRCKRCGFDLWIRKLPWSKKWQPTVVFLPGKFHGQSRLVGYSPWGHRVRHVQGHSVFKKYITLFIFGSAGSLLLRGLFSSCGKQGLPSSCGPGLPIAVASLVGEHGL